MNDYFQGPNVLFGIRQDVKKKIGLDHQYTFQDSAQSEVIQTIEVNFFFLLLSHTS